MSSFDEQLRAGHLGEVLVEEYLQDRLGWYVIPSYEFSGDDKAPRMKCMASRLIIPDLDCCGKGVRRWVEVKTNRKAAWNRKIGAYVHGVKRRLYWDYVRVCEESGAPVLLCVLEVESGVLLAQDISRMEPLPCMCKACRNEAFDMCSSPIRDQVYFKRDYFDEWHRFRDGEMEDVRVAFGVPVNETISF